MITREYLYSRLDYNPLTGVFIWKRRPGNERTINTWNTRYSGKVAGTVRLSDKSDDLYYRFIHLDGKQRRSHRLAWLYVYGENVELVDHIDGDGLNNRISNLRPLSQSNNIRKGKLQVNNTSGMKGVSLRADTGKWTARCKVGKQYKSLGSFDTKEQAFEAYCSKVFELTGELHLDLITKEDE
jgi:hypothetical protein